MRYLHPVGPHEAFVASGSYHYYADDEATGLVEHWTIHELPDGAWFIRVDKDGRDFDGRSEWIEAWRGPVAEGGRIERFDVVYSGVMADVPRRVRATYTMDDTTLVQGRSFDDQARLQDEIALPQPYAVQPGSYLFFGMLLPTMVENAPYPVVMRYGVHEDMEQSFLAVVTYPTVTFEGEETLIISGRERAARRYIAAASNPEAKPGPRVDWHTYWIDENNIFLRHTGPGFRVELERYAHRPEP
jgi:hypothetical protein